MQEDEKQARYHCRVCGLNHYPLQPWGENGDSATFVICECCGTTFGYEDGLITAIRAQRQRWIDGGAKWFQPRRKPESWKLEEQLRNIPPQYL